MSKLVENFLQSLYTDKRVDAKEWRGANRPTGDDSNRTNLIRQCFTLESSKMKINCLRKLRDSAAMNPFYQARLDRFVDAITQTYEPTDKPGTIPGNEFKETAVGEDLHEDMDMKCQSMKANLEKLRSTLMPLRAKRQQCGEDKDCRKKYILAYSKIDSEIEKLQGAIRSQC